MNSLRHLMEKDLILRAGIEVPAYVHYQYTDLWLVKIPSVNWSTVDVTPNKDDKNVLPIQ